MAIYESDSGMQCPLHVMGNGRMLVYGAGTALWSIQGGMYTSPYFASLYLDTGGGYYESETKRLPQTGNWRHWLRCTADKLTIDSSVPADADLVITDFMAAEQGVFVRWMEGKAAVRWKLVLPSYVRTVYQNDYRFIRYRADAVFCTVPAGTSYESGVGLVRELAMTVIFCGNIQFDRNSQTVYFDGGKGQIVFIDRNDPAETVKAADRLLRSLSSSESPEACALWQSSAKMWGKRLSCLPRPEKMPLCAEEGMKGALGNAAAALLAMQSADGAIVMDHRHPYASAADLPVLTAALLKLNQLKAAGRMISYWAANVGAQESEPYVPAFLGCDVQMESPGKLSEGVSCAGFLLSAVMMLEIADGDELPANESLYRKMRKTFSVMMSHFCDGMLLFSGSENCFEAEILNRDCLFQGSAAATAIAIAAANRYIDYCRSTNRKIARESGRYLALLKEAEEKFSKHFECDSLYRMNAPTPEDKFRRSRFIRGICPVCGTTGSFSAVEWLELNKQGRYRCRRCFTETGSAPSKTDDRPSCYSLDATAAAAFWLPAPLAGQAIEKAAKFYRTALKNEQSLPLREGGTDALLLTAAYRCGSSDADVFEQALKRTAGLSETRPVGQSGILSAWTEGFDSKGSFCSSAAIASFIIAVLEIQKKN